MDLDNRQLQAHSLPNIDTIVFEALEKNHQKVSIYFTSFFFIFLITAYGVVGLFVEELFFSPLIYIVLILWFLIFFVSVYVAYKSYYFEGYGLRQKDILFKSGMWFRSVIVVPFNRVQHCEINQGPIDRMFGLVELSLFTAGGSSSDLHIPGLSQETAARLKQFITRQVSQDEEE
ncbi:MAG: PH domain-containing protein [Saprospiraceae bacterium]|nr:PH domain-containing protein [Saprospiraceae bacterium]